MNDRQASVDAMTHKAFVDFRRLSEETRSAPQRAVRAAYGVIEAASVTDEIKAANVTLSAAQSALQDAVEHAVRLGLSWTEIGRSLGITKQAAHQRFGP